MADLTKIFGGPLSAQDRIPAPPPEEQLREAIAKAGLTPPDEIYLDGRIHRFRSGTKGTAGASDRAGWYIAFPDGVPAGRFGCWRAGIEMSWRAEIGRSLSPEEEMAISRRMAEAKAARDEELEKMRQIAADTVWEIWQQAQAADPGHPYLKRKGIQPHGARVTGDGRLIVPLYNSIGQLSSIQYISHDGTKLYHPGAQTGGCFWMLGTMDEPGVLYIAEGFATAATIHEATGRPVVVAYSASNLVPVTGIMRERFGIAQDIVIVADNDLSGVGQRYAEQACAKYGARMIMPPERGMDANDYFLAGHDLISLLMPPRDDFLVSADDFAARPYPISWLVKKWLQAGALIMVHGPSGGGKTFIVLDWCLRIASGTGDWLGHKVKHGAVVYLAGEGHHGLRARIAAWKKHYSVKSVSMWLSKEGCDLNSPEGYMRVVEHIRMLPQRPVMIVVDTLHRFLAGDENSAQDAKTMLDACSGLMREFGCSVLLVHHTGVSIDAQHRARGSSAWRGALDIEINIVPGENTGIQIVQKKAKDAELAQPVSVRLHQVELPEWLDDDGQPVTSAVIVADNNCAPAQVKVDTKIEAHRKLFESAWLHSGAEDRSGMPYISRSALLDYLVTKMGLSEPSAKIYLRPGASGRLISDLLVAGIIEPFEHGWVVSNKHHADMMMMIRGGRK